MKTKKLFFVLLVLVSIICVACKNTTEEADASNLDGNSPENTDTSNPGDSSPGNTDASNPDGSSPGSSSSPKYEKSYWGEWIRMDANETWYIASDYIKIGSSKTSKTLSLSKQSENIIKVTEGSKEYYLYANRTPTATISGKVASFDDASIRSVAGGKGWIQVVIDNLTNGGDSTTVTTDGEGHFTVPGVIPGDGYTVTPQGGTPVTVTPSGDGDDVGTVTMTQGVNFKTSVAAQSSSTDIKHLYANKANSYDLKLVIKNEGNAQCTAATCDITWNSDLHVTFDDTDYRLLKTIEPSKTKEIKFAVWCDDISKEFEYKKINIKITDQETQKVYEDSVSLRFFKANMNLNFASQSSLSAFVISPTGNLFHVRNTSAQSLTVPYSKDDYYVVFSGATADTETRYTLGVNAPPNTEYTEFFDLMNYEPNNTQSSATPLTNRQTIMSYLHKNDVDMYRVNFGATAPAYRPITITNYEFYNETDKTYSKVLHAGETVRLGLVLMNNTTNNIQIYTTTPKTKLVTTYPKIQILKDVYDFGEWRWFYAYSAREHFFDITADSARNDNNRTSKQSMGNYLSWFSWYTERHAKLNVSLDISHGTTIPLTITFTDVNGNTWSDEIFVPVE